MSTLQVDVIKNKSGTITFPVAALVAEASTLAVAYNADGTVNTVTENGVTRTMAYNADGSVNTISWPIGEGVIRTQTFSYTDGALTGMTTPEA